MEGRKRDGREELEGEKPFQVTPLTPLGPAS